MKMNDEQLEHIVVGVVSRAQEQLETRLKSWKIGSDSNQIREVVGALLARQTTLMSQLATNPAIWNGHTAPLILRAMADVHINVVWILREPKERSRKFVLYGLGQAKLQLEHRRKEMESRASTQGEKDYADAIERWIETQRAAFLVDVDLGSWSGITTRQMAIEANCLDFYNYVYSSFSACVHSMWQHVAIYNLSDCTNPLHGGHHVPTATEATIDIHYLYLATKYHAKTCDAFDAATEITCNVESCFEFLQTELNKISEGDEASES